ncbi:hypothetical protein SEVIR_1G179150v4 [Setaria viridis]
MEMTPIRRQGPKASGSLLLLQKVKSQLKRYKVTQNSFQPVHFWQQVGRCFLRLLVFTGSKKLPTDTCYEVPLRFFPLRIFFSSHGPAGARELRCGGLALLQSRADSASFSPSLIPFFFLQPRRKSSCAVTIRRENLPSSSHRSPIARTRSLTTSPTLTSATS